MASPWVTRFEDQLMPTFERIAQEIRQTFPEMTARVWSSPIGSSTEFQGHCMGVDCVFKDAPPEASDCVALTIQLAYLTTRPQLTSADVCWGHPSGHCEEELMSEPLDLSDAVIQQLQANLPTLESALRAAVARRSPGDIPIG
jgi:hypothetical protein